MNQAVCRGDRGTLVTWTNTKVWGMVAALFDDTQIDSFLDHALKAPGGSYD